eukprot:507490-Ditylum_brightwellii.AAC.1
MDHHQQDQDDDAASDEECNLHKEEGKNWSAQGRLTKRKENLGCNCCTDNGVGHISRIGRNDYAILWMFIRNASNEKYANW